MLYVEREAYILNKMREQGIVLVNDLAHELDVTPMTIRRDLARLDEEGKVTKVHGGAVPRESLQADRPYGVKRLVHPEQKNSIANAALPFVPKGGVILLDAGTTTYDLALMLRERRDLTVLTSDLTIATELCRGECRLFFIGGEVDRRLMNTTGPKALDFLADVHVDTLFLGIGSITPQYMLCSHSFERAALKRRMIACAEHRVLLADGSKFFGKALSEVAPLEAMDVLVTDREFSPEQQEAIAAREVRLVVCPV